MTEPSAAAPLDKPITRITAPCSKASAVQIGSFAWQLSAPGEILTAGRALAALGEAALSGLATGDLRADHFPAHLGLDPARLTLAIETLAAGHVSATAPPSPELPLPHRGPGPVGGPSRRRMPGGGGPLGERAPKPRQDRHGGRICPEQPCPEPHEHDDDQGAEATGKAGA